MDTGEHWALASVPWESTSCHFMHTSLWFYPPFSFLPLPTLHSVLRWAGTFSPPPSKRIHWPHRASLPAWAARLEPVTLHLCSWSPVGQIQERSLIKDCRQHGTPVGLGFSVFQSREGKAKLSTSRPSVISSLAARTGISTYPDIFHVTWEIRSLKVGSTLLNTATMGLHCIQWMDIKSLEPPSSSYLIWDRFCALSQALGTPS